MPTLVQKFGRNTAGRDLFCGDVHGVFDLLECALDRTNFDPAADRLFMVGDLIDRGPESDAALEFLRRPGVHAVRGNHEQNLLDLYSDGDPPHAALSWVCSRDGLGWWLDVPESRRFEYLAAFEQLPLAMEIESERGNIGVIHAEVPIGMSWQSFLANIEAGDAATIESCLWGRNRAHRRDESGVAGIGRVFAGHTPQWSGLTRLGNVFFIDTGAVFGALGIKESGLLSLVEGVAKTTSLCAPRPDLGSLLIDARMATEKARGPFSSYSNASGTCSP